MPALTKILLSTFCVLVPAAIGLGALVWKRYNHNNITFNSFEQGLGEQLLESIDDMEDSVDLLVAAVNRLDDGEHDKFIEDALTDMGCDDGSLDGQPDKPVVMEVSLARKILSVKPGTGSKSATEFTNLNRLAAVLVAKCKQDIIVSRHTEANTMVVRRWFMMEMKHIPDLRLKHRDKLLTICTALVFVPTATDITMRRVMASKAVTNRQEEGERHWFTYLSPSYMHPFGRRMEAHTASAV